MTRIAEAAKAASRPPIPLRQGMGIGSGTGVARSRRRSSRLRGGSGTRSTGRSSVWAVSITTAGGCGPAIVISSAAARNERSVGRAYVGHEAVR